MAQIKLMHSAHGEHMMCTRVYTLVQTSLYVPNKFHARYGRVECALNAFGARLKHASVRSMRVPILFYVASVACPKRV